MKTKLSTIILGTAALAVTGAGFALAQALDAATQARVERFEKGPATINVSKYPAGIQENYTVFSQKCSQCHKLSRPINSDYALPDEWSRYIHRMMNKPGSGIGAGDGKKIYEFLVYDSSIRKKAMLDQKFSQISAADKAAAEAKIKEVQDKYH
jgi:cytochrome c5